MTTGPVGTSFSSSKIALECGNSLPLLDLLEWKTPKILKRRQVAALQKTGGGNCRYSVVQNPKSEIRSTKQIQSTKFPNSKQSPTAGVHPVLQAAQDEVARLGRECMRLGAFEVSRGQVDAARAAVAAAQANKNHVAEAPLVGVARVCRAWLLVARLHLAHFSAEWEFGEPLLVGCIAVVGFTCVLALCAVSGMSVRLGIGVSLSTLALLLAVLLGISRYLPAHRAAWILDEETATRAARVSAVAKAREDLRRVTAWATHIEQLWSLKEQYALAQERWDLLKGQFDETRLRLLGTDWRSMRGVEFEGFLEEVFQALGFEVETTKASGDQGVDLKANRGADRLAIQAKGYEGSVGNSAVQEVYAGMAHYRCNKCMVVTNSAFTSGAKALAESTQCILVDAELLPELIRGNVV